MRNVWLKYTLIRLGLFAFITILLGIIGVTWVIALIFGMMLSFAISLIFLSKLRDEMSKRIYARRSRTLGNADDENELENQILDGDLENNSEKTPAKTKSKKQA